MHLHLSVYLHLYLYVYLQFLFRMKPVDTLIISIRALSTKGLITLAADGKGEELKLCKEKAACSLGAMQTDGEEVIAGLGSRIKNVLFLTGGALKLEDSLVGNTQRGMLNFKEPGSRRLIAATVTRHPGGRIVALYFEEAKTAKRFVEKKLMGEMIVMNSAEMGRFPFYPGFKEAYLFASSFVEIGHLGYLNCGDSIDAAKTKISDVAFDPKEGISLAVDDTDFPLVLPVNQKKRLVFAPASGLNIVRLSRGCARVLDENGAVFWELHDEIFKIYVN